MPNSFSTATASLCLTIITYIRSSDCCTCTQSCYICSLRVTLQQHVILSSNTLIRTAFRLSQQSFISMCAAKYRNKKKFFACLNVGLTFHYISASYFFRYSRYKFLLDSGFVSIFTNSPSCLKLSCFLWSTHIFTFEKVQLIIVLVY